MKICLIGNPNCGKTTLFNNLTKSNAKVGNWPGVTVEKKVGVYKRKKKENIEITDLPGIYSLSPYTDEEVVSRDFIVDNDDIDCVVNIVDATNLERNLYLTTQLLEMDKNVIVALNFMDVCKKRGDIIDVDKLSEFLGVKVVFISALKNHGLDNLIEAIEEQKGKKREGTSFLNLDSNLIKVVENVTKTCVNHGIHSPIFHGTKFLENDKLEKTRHPFLEKECEEFIEEFKQNSSIDNLEEYIANSRYKQIEKRAFEFYSRSFRKPYTTTEVVDKILTNKYFGIPIFALVMFLIFQITFANDFLFIGAMSKTDGIPGLGTYLQSLIEKLFEITTDGISKGLTSINAPLWSISLINEGIFNSIGSVISFLPQVLILFAFIEVLENVGYMSRVAFIFDRILRHFGLSGRSLVPLISCFGCAVPGIMGTRTIENEEEKRMAIGLTPFFSCSAKLPLYLAFGSTIAANYIDGAIIAFIMYFVGILVSIIVAFILHNVKFTSKDSSFIMELPSYHTPQFKATSLAIFDELKKFLIRAGTIIASASLVLWFMSNFTWSYQYIGSIENGIDKSIISDIGRFIQPLFYPLGFSQGEQGWKFIVASLTGLVAKEQAVASLELLSGGNGLASLLNTLDASRTFAFLAFNLLSLPCVAAMGAAKSELKNKKNFVFVILEWVVTSYATSMFIYSFGSVISIANGYSVKVQDIVFLVISVLIIALCITYAILRKKGIIKFKYDNNKNDGNDNDNNNNSDNNISNNQNVYKRKKHFGCSNCCH